MLAAPAKVDSRYRPAVSPDNRDPVDAIIRHIRVFRGHPVLLDADLAGIYGVPAKRLMEQVRRHEPLPGDFCFEPEPGELNLVGEDGAARRHPRYAFTEHGAFMAAILLKTPEAIALSVKVVRAFVRLRERPMNHGSLALRLIRPLASDAGG